jgi:hypothetical protein
MTLYTNTLNKLKIVINRHITMTLYAPKYVGIKQIKKVRDL